MTGEYLELTTHRLRAFDLWEASNPVESGIVRYPPTATERFWARADAKRAADAAIRRAGAKA